MNQTSKTYAKKATAQGIATKLSKQTGREHTVLPVKDGWMVAAVQIAKPRKPRQKRIKTPVEVTAPFVRNSNQYLDLNVGGKVVFVSKNVPSSLQIDEEAKLVTMLVPQFYAEKKGLPFQAA